MIMSIATKTMNKRNLSDVNEGVTDNDSISPDLKIRTKCSEQVLESVFSEADIEKIGESFDIAHDDDPLLVLKWNPAWLAIANNHIIKQQVLQFLLGHSTDEMNSEFIFHFQSFQSLLGCREAMRTVIPAAFTYPPGLVATFNNQYGINIPAPVPMAQAWIIIKTAVLATDYREDVVFFVNIN